MIRISGGEFKGRQLQVPRSGVRPTKDMVREAMFSVLGESILDKRVVDLFAGSGAIGIEAMSRGAAEAVWIEKDPHTFGIAKKNVETVCGPDAASNCIKADALGWLKSGMGRDGYDLIVADPPYNVRDESPVGGTPAAGCRRECEAQTRGPVHHGAAGEGYRYRQSPLE